MGMLLVLKRPPMKKNSKKGRKFLATRLLVVPTMVSPSVAETVLQQMQREGRRELSPKDEARSRGKFLKALTLGAGVRFVSQFAGPRINQGRILIEGGAQGGDKHFTLLEDSGFLLGMPIDDVPPESIEIFTIEPRPLLSTEFELLSRLREALQEKNTLV